MKCNVNFFLSSAFIKNMLDTQKKCSQLENTRYTLVKIFKCILGYKSTKYLYNPNTIREGLLKKTLSWQKQARLKVDP